ncbi:MAG: GDP-mannose 4,6-dehydratase [Planctomycetes bacterium]|nr:GDP-mannose 4,6-dehydratase [Planctomycetota bacterium]
MRALVTGGDGFVGRYLVAALQQAGWTVELFRGDVRRPDALRRFRGDAVFHLAAQAHPARSREIPMETFEVNVLGTQRVLEALSGFGGRILVVSTGDIYRPDRQPRQETDPIEPRSPYGWSKRLAEAVARAQDRLDIVIARPFNHTGPGQSEAYVCPGFARQVATRRVVRVGELGSVRDFLDVRDVVRAYLLLIERGRRGETYNIASGHGWRIGQILNTLIELSGRSVRIVVDPARTRPPDSLIGDASRLHARTGWRPRIPFRRTLAELLRLRTQSVTEDPEGISTPEDAEDSEKKLLSIPHRD